MPDTQAGKISRTVTLGRQIPVQDAGYTSLIPQDVMASQITMGKDPMLRTERRESLDCFPGQNPRLGIEPGKHLIDLNPVPGSTPAKRQWISQQTTERDRIHGGHHIQQAPQFAR
ncbi:hypothetical protein GCM10025778_05910 [Paeniglutamicibacter antarcticus]|uniref:Uncharacterized protein n=1 Tax=Paeniglutamicibacter antarcticus TaxID=494023 RepID=A0ABP9TI57_9MICC